LGIEGTAHTFGVGIINSEGKVLANEKSVYNPQLGKGIVPHEAAQHHKENCEKILKNALLKANLELKDIDVLAYSCGPGLSPPLIFTANFAIELSKKHKKPLLPANHCVAHLEIGKLMTHTKEPVYMYLSGGNTQVIAFVEGKYRIFGETEDIPIGNCLDIVSREMGLPMPGGVEIEKLAKNGEYVELPYVVKGMDVSFSGIATAAIRLLKDGVRKENVAYSLQETCFSMLTEVTERAVAHIGKEEVLLVGGVAVNKRLQQMVNQMCEEREAKMYVVPKEYGGDNGLMIAWTGLLAYKSGWKPGFKDKIKPKWRTDEVSWFQT